MALRGKATPVRPSPTEPFPELCPPTTTTYRQAVSNSNNKAPSRLSKLTRKQKTVNVSTIPEGEISEFQSVLGPGDSVLGCNRKDRQPPWRPRRLSHMFRSPWFCYRNLEYTSFKYSAIMNSPLIDILYGHHI